MGIVEKALQHKPEHRFSSPEEMVKAIKKARTSKKKVKPKNRPHDSGTQALDEATPLSFWVAAALTVAFLGFGSYAIYEVLLKGTGG